MEYPAPDTVPVKLTLSGSKRRSRLNVPLKFSQLLAQVRSTFPDVKDFNLQYVDEEGDEIAVTCDADLEEASSVFKSLGRVLTFTVNTKAKAASPIPPEPTASPFPCAFPWFGHGRRGHRGCRNHMRGGQTFTFPKHFREHLRALCGNGSVPHFGITCDGSNQHPLLGKRYHKIGHNYDLNATEFAKLMPEEQKKYEMIAFPGAVPIPVDTSKVLHHGVTCDVSNQHPIVGKRYHKIGCNYDLNEAEFSKLTSDEQKKYEIITHPGATPIAVTTAPDCVFLRDVTIPDGQVFPPGKQFTKTWLVKTGVSGWPAGCALTHISGDKMGATRGIVLGPQNPHTCVEIAIAFTVPSKPGKVTSKWRVAGPDGKTFGHHLWCTVLVKPPAHHASSRSFPPPPTTMQPPPTTMAATHVPAHSGAPPPPPRSVASVVAAACPPTVSVSPPAASDTKLQQLLDMGFALPIETLRGVLNSTQGNLRAAVNRLVSRKF